MRDQRFLDPAAPLLGHITARCFFPARIGSTDQLHSAASGYSVSARSILAIWIFSLEIVECCVAAVKRKSSIGVVAFNVPGEAGNLGSVFSLDTKAAFEGTRGPLYVSTDDIAGRLPVEMDYGLVESIRILSLDQGRAIQSAIHVYQVRTLCLRRRASMEARILAMPG